MSLPSRPRSPGQTIQGYTSAWLAWTYLYINEVGLVLAAIRIVAVPISGQVGKACDGPLEGIFQTVNLEQI